MDWAGREKLVPTDLGEISESTVSGGPRDKGKQRAPEVFQVIGLISYILKSIRLDTDCSEFFCVDQ